MIGRPRELPSKLFFRIGEVAGLVGVEPHVLRYWEREFRSIRPTKSAKGQRVYSRKDVENLLRVRDLLYRDGFTIAGAKKKLQRSDAFDDAEMQAADGGGVAGPGVFAQGVEIVAAETANDAGPESFADASSLDAAVELASSVVEPVGPTSGSVVRSDVRDKLVALRDEVEEFLMELSTNTSV